MQALERLESKPPKLPATAADSGSDVSDVELSESEESEAEAAPARGGRRRGAAGAAAAAGGQEVQSAGGRDVVMADAPAAADGVLAAWGVQVEAAAPSASASTALAVEEWEVWEPAAEDSGEEWGGSRRGKGRRGKRGSRKKERAEAAEAEKRAARHALPPRQRLALRALGFAASGVAAEATVADVLRQAQRQAAEAHASFAAAVPDALLVPAGTPDAPEVGVAGGAAGRLTTAAAGGSSGKGGGAAGSGKIAALLAGRPAKVADLLVPSTAPAFEQLTDLPQYRRNLESHCE